jgi:hypothetical protein
VEWLVLMRSVSSSYRVWTNLKAIRRLTKAKAPDEGDTPAEALALKLVSSPSPGLEPGTPMLRKRGGYVVATNFITL